MRGIVLLGLAAVLIAGCGSGEPSSTVVSEIGDANAVDDSRPSARAQLRACGYEETELAREACLRIDEAPPNGLAPCETRLRPKNEPCFIRPPDEPRGPVIREAPIPQGSLDGDLDNDAEKCQIPGPQHANMPPYDFSPGPRSKLCPLG